MDGSRVSPVSPLANDDMAVLTELERKILWLASWTIHNANHLRANTDGLKVGGHQASCASLTTIMTALYLATLRPQDRVAVKPHAAPVFHAIQYLLGQQTQAKLQDFRALGGAQSYPSRTKDTDDVDFSTGSVGLGVALTSFSSLIADYVRLHKLAGERQLPQGRHIAIAGDAELDEGNIYEALLEGWKHDIRNVWWIVDYNRQSLDSVVPDRLFGRIEGLFRDMGWNVVTLKYGRKLEAAFARQGGEALRAWIDDCPNSLYSALTFQGGAAWRAALLADLGRNQDVRAIVEGQFTEVPQVWKLDYLSVMTGVIPTATVRLLQAGQTEPTNDAGTGDGPIDAMLKTVDRITGTKGSLVDYSVGSVTKGKDAIGEVSVRVEFTGRIVTGKGTSTDIIEASALAYLNALNRYLDEQRRRVDTEKPTL